MQIRKDTLFGLIVLFFGLTYLAMTLQIPPKDGVDARTVPLLLAGIMTIMGVAQLAIEYMSKAKADAPSGIDWKTVSLTALLLLAYVALLEAAGFVIASALYLFFQILLLIPLRLKKNIPLIATISVVGSIFIYCVFRFGFDLMLPTSFLGI
jgi:putative tricarboxylic transport membrane protein